VVAGDANGVPPGLDVGDHPRRLALDLDPHLGERWQGEEEDVVHFCQESRDQIAPLWITQAGGDDRVVPRWQGRSRGRGGGRIESEGESQDGKVGGGAVQSLGEPRGRVVGGSRVRRGALGLGSGVARVFEGPSQEVPSPGGGETDGARGRGDGDLVADRTDGREADAEAADDGARRPLGPARCTPGRRINRERLLGYLLGRGAHTREGLDTAGREGRPGVGRGEQGAAVRGVRDAQEQAAPRTGVRRGVRGVLGKFDDHPVAVVPAGVVLLEVGVLAEPCGRCGPGG